MVFKVNKSNVNKIIEKLEYDEEVADFFSGFEIINAGGGNKVLGVCLIQSNAYITVLLDAYGYAIYDGCIENVDFSEKDILIKDHTEYLEMLGNENFEIELDLEDENGDYPESVYEIIATLVVKYFENLT